MIFQPVCILKSNPENIMFIRFILWFVFLSGYSVSAFGVTGSITDPGFLSEQKSEQSFFGLLRGSVKTRFSRHLRRSEWPYIFSLDYRDNFFDKLFMKTDLSLNYPLVEALPFLKSPVLSDKALLFFVLSYRRPVYDTLEVIKWHCFKSHFCFGEMSIGISNPFPSKNPLKSQHSIYLSFPTSKTAWDQKKIMGMGASLSMNYSLFSKADFQISGISSHFLDTAVYGDLHADAQGSKGNDIFSVFNQVGVRFSLSGRSFIPIALVYVSHAFSLDYKREWFNGLSLGCSAVWSLSKQIQIVAGLNWGGAIFRHEYTARAKKAKPFNPDETNISGGFSYSF